MSDRLREALDDWVQEYVWLLQQHAPKVPLEPLEVIVEAAGGFLRLAESVDADELRDILDTDRCQPQGDDVVVRRDHHNALWNCAAAAADYLTEEEA